MKRRVRLRYSDTINMNPPAGTLLRHTFRVTDCVDPDYSGAGHQPLSWDQVSAFYKRYSVIGFKYRIRPVAWTDDNDVIWGTSISPESSPSYSSITAFREGVGTKVRYLNPGVTTKSVVTGNTRPKRWIPNKWYEDERAGFTGNGGVSSSPPTANTYLHIFCGPADYTSDINTVYFALDLEYDILLWDRIPDTTTD